MVKLPPPLESSNFAPLEVKSTWGSMATFALTGATINAPTMNPVRRDASPTSPPPTVAELIPAVMPSRRGGSGVELWRAVTGREQQRERRTARGGGA